ncbi:VOC family protein [Amaricoccus sp.]|uniref:VOC family protein n=1 Tax=Amaricoccus sp. TaxID=1872485 RepID=UPI001B76D980|nr:VOC family protein [Amaricoccus sp.]MBP7001235.1 VOC family protein [Amaricoccus sp.]
MSHRSRLAALVIDCKGEDLDAAAAFWSAALGLEARPGATPNYVELGAVGALQVEVQVVDHESRVHLDIAADDIPAEVARLEGLGAAKVGEVRTWTIMQAPTGQRFCIIEGRSEAFRASANVWED